MDYLPLFLNVRDQPCLVVGGGEVAARKIGLLLRAGARLTVIAPQVDAALAATLAEANATVLSRKFASGDVQGQRLVIAATSDIAVNAAVSEAAQALNIPDYAVDQPDLCSPILPFIVDRSPTLIAISCGGRSP
ncbi:MAG TPA: bifunctional precorrin-2 dehydrogenase/sirohydrochlorin ferrochelatase, partial [Spongiibacteraceae bacterium]|nr:bifunctional precorrin-2 dehydrogenase/sirohydrochlorin ferrochelatase [Spongiibacteraceae bacterium]